MNRRGFLSSIIACAAAPAFIGASNPTIWVPRSTLIVPAFNGSLVASMVPEYVASVFYKPPNGVWHRCTWKSSSADMETMRRGLSQFPAGTTLYGLQVEQAWPRLTTTFHNAG